MKPVQDISTWFGEAPTSFIDYFEDDFRGNTIGTLKFPATSAARFNNIATEIDKAALANAVASSYLWGIVKLKWKQLGKTPFYMLEADTQKYLKDAVCEAVQFAVLNKQVWERVNASSISTNTFSVNQDTTSWILTADMYGKMAWNLIQISGIDEYEWVEEDVLFTGTEKGNVKIIGRTDVLNETFWKVA